MKRGNKNFFNKAGFRKNLEKDRRKRNIIIWFIVIVLVIIALVFLLRGMTGWAINTSGSNAKKVVRTCVDSDKDSQHADGLNFNVYGEVLYAQKKYKDKCLMNKWLYERYCQVTESGKVYSSLKAFKCPGRCKNGACESEVVTCTDSDGGLNFDVKGVVTNGDETKEDKCKTGKETETLILDENEEENFTINDIDHKMKVVGITQNKVRLSLDNDEAVEINESLSLKINNLTILAKQVFLRKKPLKSFAIIEVRVETVSNKLLVEYICDKHDSNKKGINERIHVCPGGCFDGACLAPKCVDSDGGKKYFVKGNVSQYLNNNLINSANDICINPIFCEVYAYNKTAVYSRTISNCSHIVDSTTKIVGSCFICGHENVNNCSGDNCFVDETYCDRIKKRDVEYKCSNGCQDGACIQTSAPASGGGGGGSSVKCTDSDGGKNYFVKGTAKDDSINLTDLCYQYSKADPAKKDAIAEYYCDSTGRVKGEWYNCTYGCENGACKRQSATPICVDSDTGKNFTIKGEVKVDGVSKGVDSCLSGNRTLKEYYCSGKYSLVYYEYCTKGCSNGICLS